MTGRCILAAIDLGTETGKIVAYAARFSAVAQAPVRLLYVMDYLLTPPAYLMPHVEEEKKRDEAEMVRWLSVLEKEGISADYRLMTGRLHESFVTAAAEYVPDLLIIGHASHALRPSSSERLIKSLRMPMLVVRGARSEDAATGGVQIRNILCAVDFSESSRKALQCASAYASAFSASLRIVHAVPSHSLKDRWTKWTQGGKSEREQFEKAVSDEAEAALDRLIRDAGISAPVSLAHGVPSEVVCAEAERGGHDLVVIGARGLSYIKGMFIGSVAEAVIKASPCPVLIVH